MKECEFLVSKELGKSFFRDYLILTKVSELEERIKRIEEKPDFIYKGVLGATSKPLSPEEEYKKTQIFPISNEDWELKKWEEELKFFNSVKRELLKDKAYKNKYVAIKDKKLIDSDIDKFSLVKRINKKYPNEVVLIVKVEREMQVIEIPSPEVLP